MDRLRPFFSPPRDEADGRAELARDEVRWAIVYDALTDAGYGKPSELARYTERQLRLYFERLTARENRRRADLIETISFGYSRSRSDKVRKQLVAYLDALRK